ncbi:hypothetical protein B0H66DRAFT_642184 [Apodospora peruviana]|uniref:Uncharacterized protein n=1 Tax=Apodospora peruviana TaxID=516989 RepID=A0AAE0M0X0_9PEZI|nr:hypothetical protein B0H66DRAFT_642184 [Apodospora peruviana]
MATPGKHPSADFEIQRLGQLCLPRWYDRIGSVVVRPERPEFAETMKGQPANPSWTRTLDQMRQAISSYGGDQQQRQQARRGRLDGTTPMDAFFEDLEAFDFPDDKAKPILGAIDLILYNQECSGTRPPYRPDAYRHLIEHMLLIGYGIGRCRKRQLPSLREWQALASTLLNSCGTETPEAALGLYYYHTHCQDLGEVKYSLGHTPYTGVMQELIDEVPIKGPDRLLRKLSVDYHVLIPQCVAGRRWQLMDAAEALAEKYGLVIHAPEIKDV